MSDSRRRALARRRKRRKTRTLLVAALAILAVIGAGAVVEVKWSAVGSDPAAQVLAKIPTSKAGALLEAERQTMILEASATNSITMVGTPQIAAMPTPASDDAGTAATFPAPDPDAAQLTAQQMMPSFGFSVASQYTCLYDLWQEESGWRYNAENASGAYGIPQALPGSKMASAGADWLTDPATQIKWGLGYISDVYGTPCGAWDHEVADGWY